MRKSVISLAAALGLLAVPGQAKAEDGDDKKWYAHAGPVLLVFNEEAEISLDGNVVPDASATISPDVTIGLEVGYKLTKNFAISGTVGIPPSANMVGTGPLEGVSLGRAVYGPAILTAHYHVTDFGPSFEPYFGAGVAYLIIFDSKDGAVTDLEVDNNFGFVLQGGFETKISDNKSLFVDAKYTILDTEATGFVGPSAATADITLDPLLISAGLSIRF